METRTSLVGSVALAAIIVMGTPALAQGRGGGMGGGAHIGSGMGANSMGVGGMSGANGRFGGMSDSHISTQGSLNTNGPNATHRDFGLDRAHERANANADLDTKSADADASTTNTARADNSNGPSAIDRDYGYDRGQDRMNKNGASNSQAESHISGTPGAGIHK